ncbi:MAG TPA: hypothetical protein VMT34_09470, partial [Aggregatilineales bacterium]|nr:hypothetical protein [Aggregatilineales bacterium]
MASSVLDRIRIHATPIAKPESIVIAGKARFTVLTSRLLRLEWSATGQFENRGTFAFPNRSSLTPPFTSHSEAGRLTIDTGALRLTYRIDDGPFTAENLTIDFKM